MKLKHGPRNKISVALLARVVRAKLTPRSNMRLFGFALSPAVASDPTVLKRAVRSEARTRSVPFSMSFAAMLVLGQAGNPIPEAFAADAFGFNGIKLACQSKPPSCDSAEGIDLCGKDSVREKKEKLFFLSKFIADGLAQLCSYKIDSIKVAKVERSYGIEKWQYDADLVRSHVWYCAQDYINAVKVKYSRKDMCDIASGAPAISRFLK